jgi:outer membrane autotransporter protein
VLNSVTSRPLQLILQYTQINPTQSVAQNIRATLRLGAIFFGANPNTSTMSMSTQNAETLDDLFGVSGLRGYGFVMGSTGSMTGDIDTLSRGLTLGMDYTTPVSGGTMRVGLAINGSKSKTSNDELSIDTETKMAQLYGIYRSNGGLQVLGLASYGKSEDSVNRDTGTVWGHGDQDVTAKSFGIEVGQRFAAGGPASVLMPYVGVSKEIYDADTYTDNLGSVIPGYDQDVSFGKIGLRWENAVGTSIGMVHTEVDASWNRVINEDASIKSGGTVALTAPSTDKDRFDLAVNFGLDTNGGGRVLMTVAGSKSENVSYGSLGLGFEMNF